MTRGKISIAVAIVLISIMLIAVVSKTNNKVQIQQLNLQTKQQELDLLQEKLEQNNETKAKTQQELDTKLKENKKLQDEIEALQAKKAEEKRIAAEQAQNAVLADSVQPQTVSAQQPSGDWVVQCHAWAAQAGIVLTPSAIQLLERESHCSNTAQNPTSSACGIAQNINGCGSAGYGHDPISQLIWFHNYCQSRYGGFDGALAHSLANGWY